MAKKITSDILINPSQSWSGKVHDGYTASSDALPFSGDQIETFIKRQFGTKVGYVYRTPEKQDDGNYHLQFFATEETYNTWASDKDVHADLLLGDVVMPEGGGSQMTASYYDGLYTNTSTTGYVTTDGTFVVEIRFTSQLHNPVNNSDEDTGNAGTLVIQRRASETESWQTVGRETISSTPAAETSTWKKVDLSKYLFDGSQNIRLQVVDDAAGMKTRYLQYSNVVKTNLRLTFATEWWRPMTDVINLAYYINGAVDKTLHIQISGEGGTRTLEYKIGNTVYADTPWTASVGDTDMDAVKVLTHGVHKIEAWLTVGDSTTTEHLLSQVFVKKDAADAKSYMVINSLLGKVANYTDAELFDYAVFTANDAAIDVTVSAGNSKGDVSYGKTTIKNVAPGEKHAYNNMLEVDGETAKNVTAYLSFTDKDNSQIADKVAVMVDNSVNFAPTDGADFVLNPKNRNNDETAAQSILNDKDGSTVGSTWTGFSMTSDGWGTDDKGVKCLKIPAGESVSIDYEAFSGFLGDKAHTDSLTVEFDLMVSHISDEDEPLIQMCSYNTVDGKQIPVGLLLRGKTMMFSTVGKKTLYHQEIHLEEDKRTHIALNIVYNLYNKGINYVKFFVNSDCNRKFEYDANDTFVQYVDGKQTSQGIRFGGKGADLTIYGMRVYKKALGVRDVMQDSLGHLGTAKEKRDFLAKNDILNDDGSISFSKARAKYNTICYTGSMPNYRDKAKRASGIDIDIHKPADPTHSGKLNNMSGEGQGSSSRGYWDWNWRSKFNDDSRFVSEDGTLIIAGGYQLDDSVPRAKKLDLKINWASSMQFRKMGACNMFNVLWKKICGGNSITKTPGFENCRVAVKQEQFLVFQRDSESEEPKFVGLGTFGPAKADKPTFWGDPKKFPNLLMIEGSDNGRPLTLCQVPWMDDEVTFDPEEGWYYDGNISWDYDLGTIGDVEKEPNSVAYFKNAFTQVFLHAIATEPHEGNLTALKADAALNKATQYWITEDEGVHKKYDLFRYDYITKDWVNASATKTNGVYDRLNLNEQCGGVGSGADWEATNKQFIAKRIEWARSDDGFKKYFQMDDTLFNKCFIKILALSDNLCKNIYPYTDPTTFLIRWFSDDNDSFGRGDNVGDNTKTYHVEEQDTVANGGLKEGEGGWNGADNNFFNLLEAAFPSEIREMTKKILTTMAELASEGGYGSTPWDFIQHYLFDIAEYFPDVAYNETGRVRYEEAAVAMKAGLYTNATDPLIQDLGNNLSAEKDWWKWRLVYMSSYCGYGAFSNRGTGSLFFRSTSTVNGGTRPEYKFKLKPAVWLYLNGFMGQQMVYGTGQTMPQRMIPGNTYELDMTGDENTDIGICGADYFKSFGNFGDKSLGATFNLSGERLEEFVANKVNGVMEFRPTSINVSDCPVLKKFDIEGASTVGGTLDLTGCTKLNTINTKGTRLSSTELPSSGVLESVAFGTPQTITLMSLSGLKSFQLESASALTYCHVARLSSEIDTYQIAKLLKEVGAVPQTTVFEDISWTDVDSDVIRYCALNGFTLKGQLTYTNSNLTFDDKRLLLRVYGNVDDTANALHATYTQHEITAVKLSLDEYISTANKDYPISVGVSPDNGNNFKSLSLVLSGSDGYGRIDDIKDVLHSIKVGSTSDLPKGTVTLNVTLMDGSVLSASQEIKYYRRVAEVGDIVYADGTYNNKIVVGKTPVGICFWVNSEDPNDRLMCALQSYYDQWGILNDDSIKLTDSPTYNCSDTSVANSNDGDLTTLKALPEDFGPYKQGQTVRLGIYNQYLLIKHRNKILTDSGINLAIPQADSTKTELDSLKELLTEASAKGDAVRREYYPAESYCYAYQPSVKAGEALAEKFTAHHWWLPIIATVNLMWDADKAGKFDYAVNLAIASHPSAQDNWSCQERDDNYAWYVYSGGGVLSQHKDRQCAVRAVAAF